MTTTARDKAERCFALARSTTFDGEREAAISRGTAICERAGLSLDLFDIPGRVKAAPKPNQRGARLASEIDEIIASAIYGSGTNTSRRPAWGESSINADDLIRQMAQFNSMRARAAAASFDFTDLANAMKEHDARVKRARLRAKWPNAIDAASHCFVKGTPVYDVSEPGEPREWFAPGLVPDHLDDDQLRELAASLS